jgi:hypothetical protein
MLLVSEFLVAGRSEDLARMRAFLRMRERTGDANTSGSARQKAQQLLTMPWRFLPTIASSEDWIMAASRALTSSRSPAARVCESGSAGCDGLDGLPAVGSSGIHTSSVHVEGWSLSSRTVSVRRLLAPTKHPDDVSFIRLPFSSSGPALWLMGVAGNGRIWAGSEVLSA